MSESYVRVKDPKVSHPPDVVSVACGLYLFIRVGNNFAQLLESLMFSTVFCLMSPFLLLLRRLQNPNKKRSLIPLASSFPSLLRSTQIEQIFFFESRSRPAAKEERVTVLAPFVEELKVKRSSMPLTIFYGDLEDCAESFIHFSSELRDEQYEPIGAAQVANNRLFTQFHVQYPKHEQERIMEELVNYKSKHKVFFVTIAFGIGIDCPYIQTVIHLAVPYTMEEYFPEAGHAGRDCLQRQLCITIPTM